MNSSRWFVIAILVAVTGTTLALRESTRQRDALTAEQNAREADTARLSAICTELGAGLADLKAEFYALSADAQELALALSIEGAELEVLRQSIAEINAGLAQLASDLETPLDEVFPVDDPELLPDLPPPPATARLLSIDDIPAWRRQFIKPNTLLVSGHDSKWGQFRVRVDGENIPLVDSVAAEACALLHSEVRLLKELVMEELISNGECPLFDTREEASAYAQAAERKALLLGKDFRGYSIRPWGDQIAFIRAYQYLDAPEVLELRKRIRQLGKRLLEGGRGGYGVIWTPFE